MQEKHLPTPTLLSFPNRIRRCCHCWRCCLVVPLRSYWPRCHLPPAGEWLSLFHVVFHKHAHARHLITSPLLCAVPLHAVPRWERGLHRRQLWDLWGFSSHDHGPVCAGHHWDVQRSQQVILHLLELGFAAGTEKHFLSNTHALILFFFFSKLVWEPVSDTHAPMEQLLAAFRHDPLHVPALHDHLCWPSACKSATGAPCCLI